MCKMNLSIANITKSKASEMCMMFFKDNYRFKKTTCDCHFVIANVSVCTVFVSFKFYTVHKTM